MTYDYENCDFNEMLLYEYLDDLLDKDKSSLVTNHLSLCKSCRKKLSEIKLLFYELDNLNEVKIPTEVNEIRTIIVKEAFETNKTYDNITNTTKKIASSIITTITPTKAQMTKLAKNIYLKNTNTKIKSNKNKKNLLKNLGDFL